MKLPWSKPDVKSGESWIALAGLPGANWGRTDPATLVREGYAGNAIVYRCARMIAEAAASIALQCENEAVQNLLNEPSPDQSGQALIEQLYIDLQVTGNAWAEAVTLAGETAPRGLFGLATDAVRVRLDDRGHVAGYRVSWTARGADYPNNWELADIEQTQTFMVELYKNDALVSQAIHTETRFDLEAGIADSIHVAVMSAEGRVGEWASIPV